MKTYTITNKLTRMTVENLTEDQVFDWAVRHNSGDDYEIRRNESGGYIISDEHGRERTATLSELVAHDYTLTSTISRA